jgi:RNA polymerase sigma-70 factor (ECF subfamily)
MIRGIETTTSPMPQPGASARWGDGDVVARAKARSEAAFEQLVDQYKRRAFRVAWKITCNHEDAEDVVQNAYVKAFQNLSDFRGDSRFYTWLVRITINEALMKIRRRLYREVSIDDSKEADDRSMRFNGSWLRTSMTLSHHSELSSYFATLKGFRRSKRHRLWTLHHLR